MSKAFTREDDAGLTPIASEHTGTYGPMTPMGREALRARLAWARANRITDIGVIEARLAAGAVASPTDVAVAALGAEVTLRDASGAERVVRLVTADEVGLVERGASPISPIGAAVVGARVGDEVELQDGVEMTVTSVHWPVD